MAMVQITDDRSQMTENRNSLLFVICLLFSVLCPLYLPDTRNLTPETTDLKNRYHPIELNSIGL
jgi:hypothetical protein